MTITVELFGVLRDFSPPGAKTAAFERDIGSETTVADIIKDLGIPKQKTVTVLVNALHAKKDQRLTGGDILHLLTPIAGG